MLSLGNKVFQQNLIKMKIQYVKEDRLTLETMSFRLAFMKFVFFFLKKVNTEYKYKFDANKTENICQ